MDVKEAVQTARKYLVDIFADDNIKDVGLEEIDFDDGTNVWKVTIGFSRPWDHPREREREHVATKLPWAGMFHNHGRLHDRGRPLHCPRRSYKIVRVDNNRGCVLSVQDLELSASR